MKVIYPGPGVTGEARVGSQYFPAHEVRVSPGENELPDAIAERMIEQQLVMLPAPPVAPKRMEARKKTEPEEAKPSKASEKEGVSRGDRA